MFSYRPHITVSPVDILDVGQFVHVEVRRVLIGTKNGNHSIGQPDGAKILEIWRKGLWWGVGLMYQSKFKP